MTTKLDQTKSRLNQHILVKLGWDYFNQPKEEIPFVADPAANKQLNDIEHFPHMFVLACCMDRQIKAERAWMIPRLVGQKLGKFDIKHFGEVSLAEYRKIFAGESLHRFTDTMAVVFHAAVQRILAEYDGDAAKIWSDKPSSSTVVLRFLAFRGVGVKIATMAANILARQFRIPFADYYSIDVSPDVHVKRVMSRMGLVLENSDTTTIIYAARQLCAVFPGIIDSPLWTIGRNYCAARNPNCLGCPVYDACPTGLKHFVNRKT